MGITQSGLPIDPVYGPKSRAGWEPETELGEPGAFPYTRGVYPSMYTGRPWTMRQYAGFGTAMFDLANVAANGSYSAEQEETLLETYFGKPATNQQIESFDAMKVASALREATWAMVSSIHLKVPGADYEAHAEEYLIRTETALKHFIDRHGQP